MINKQEAALGNRVVEGDVVQLDGRIVQSSVKTLYLAFNKPVGIVCTTDSREPNNIIDYIRYPERLFPVGRLDKDSQGLIFLTNDGDIVNKILRAGNKHEKEYLVTVNKAITDDFIDKMSNGVPVLGKTTKKCKVKKVGPVMFSIVLVQGMNRQIRRMCEYLGYTVTKLKRTRIMHVSLGKLPEGQWRELTDAETERLLKLSASSSKTASSQRNMAKKKGKVFTPKRKRSKSNKRGRN